VLGKSVELRIVIVRIYGVLWRFFSWEIPFIIRYVCVVACVCVGDGLYHVGGEIYGNGAEPNPLVGGSGAGETTPTR
jgi:hypothetical protein